jgi:hypothetical protein
MERTRLKKKRVEKWRAFYLINKKGVEKKKKKSLEGIVYKFENVLL